jgi:hypothetical protein
MPITVLFIFLFVFSSFSENIHHSDSSTGRGTLTNITTRGTSPTCWHPMLTFAYVPESSKLKRAFELAVLIARQDLPAPTIGNDSIGGDTFHKLCDFPLCRTKQNSRRSLVLTALHLSTFHRLRFSSGGGFGKKPIAKMCGIFACHW